MTAHATGRPSHKSDASALALAIDDDLDKIAALNHLAEWIAVARHQIVELQACARFDRELADRLDGLRFCVGEGDWTEATQSGLRYLHQAIGAGLNDLQDRARYHQRRAARPTARKPRRPAETNVSRADLQVVKS